MLTATLQQELCNLAEGAARAAGDLLLDNFRREAQVAQRFTHDLKLELDRRCEAVIVETLREQVPDHHIVGEESGVIPGAADCPFTWYIDPLDGTANYFDGLPFFCTTLACHRHRRGETDPTGGDLAGLGEPVAGVVYAPWDDECFAAMPGLGAFLNARELPRLATASLAESVVATSFGSRAETIATFAGLNPRLADACFKVRALGCSALDGAYVAGGRLGGSYRRGIHPWDFAAARILVEETGGTVTANRLGERWEALLAAPDVFGELAALIFS